MKIERRHADLAISSEVLFEHLASLTEGGHLRRLGGAFARFIASLGQATPALLVACVALSELEGRGHSCLMLDELVHQPSHMMGWTDEQWRALLAASGPLPKNLKAWLALLQESRQVWRVGDFDFQQPLVLDGERLYLRRYWRDETLVGRAIGRRALAARIPDLAKVRAWLDRLFDQPAKDGGPDWQKIACAIALRGTVTIITGGPGTGKTYTVASLLALLFAVAPNPEQLRIAMAAPTGKAAARLKQSIDQALASLQAKAGELDLSGLTRRIGAARTLHSLLGARPDTRAFQHHAGNPLDVDVLIVDEASMVHLEMMAALLDALPDNAILILLGDKDQLASVEAGAVLGDLCHDAQAGGYSADTLAYAQAASGQRIPDQFLGELGPLAQQTVMLRHSHRFSGPIGALALAVNQGDTEAALAVLQSDSGAKVAWIEAAQQNQVLQLALHGRDGAPGGYQPYLRLLQLRQQQGEDGQEHEEWVRSVLKSFEQFRILCAVRDGEWGVSGLNTAIEVSLERAGLIRRAEWYLGRPVMVTRNDYGTGVFNGDIGLTLRDPARPDSLRVYFLEGEAVRSVLATRLRQVETAFAMTVHKSQGSEFRHTVLVLPKEGGVMLARELVYTGITRARDFFTLVTPARAVLLDAVLRRTQRASGLRGWIRR
ncbi:exodeoxyribonuclease V subunit alpha [Janthinobacterium agaricidamnosum]|uniref:RecBCD enzyme subunit RecD n=1 Tax=Janthinobacterium agaricidamnosum NBRC 102515 = DSM 9628 TaxID=1349767 RepID=W0V596_9BURK|nr:exodeoxyribonuclease V subunit alpha [Janthinobacterium agaricidamnosum]CDG82518.1 exodeoxyribonuclease V, alpha subunit [Janthinobacterium agaricidamnosum NBRC 102515 = DSM 9628]